MMIAWATLASAVVTDTIQPGVVQSVLGLVFHAVGHFFGLPGPPPALPGEVQSAPRSSARSTPSRDVAQLG